MEWEGETFENDPDDPGGATKFGIDQRSHPTLNIKALTKDQAEQIYLDEYKASRASKLTYPLNYVFFDAVVNCGESRATKLLQRAVGATPDGFWGPLTEDKYQDFLQSNDVTELCADVIDERDAFYRAIGHGRLGKFLTGWTNRTKSLSKFFDI